MSSKTLGALSNMLSPAKNLITSTPVKEYAGSLPSTPLPKSPEGKIFAYAKAVFVTFADPSSLDAFSLCCNLVVTFV